MNSFSIIKSTFLRLRQRKYESLMVTIILVLGVETFSFNAKADYFYEVKILANKCIRSRLPNHCRIALAKAEKFQLYSASKGRYDCETRLIGLQSDLIMMILNPSTNKQSAQNMLEDLENTCINF